MRSPNLIQLLVAVSLLPFTLSYPNSVSTSRLSRRITKPIGSSDLTVKVFALAGCLDKGNPLTDMVYNTTYQYTMKSVELSRGLRKGEVLYLNGRDITLAAQSSSVIMTSSKTPTSSSSSLSSSKAASKTSTGASSMSQIPKSSLSTSATAMPSATKPVASTSAPSSESHSSQSSKSLTSNSRLPSVSSKSSTSAASVSLKTTVAPAKTASPGGSSSPAPNPTSSVGTTSKSTDGIQINAAAPSKPFSSPAPSNSRTSQSQPQPPAPTSNPALGVQIKPIGKRGDDKVDVAANALGNESEKDGRGKCGADVVLVLKESTVQGCYEVPKGGCIRLVN